MMSWQQTYMERFYRGRAGWVDGTTEFHSLCARHISEGSKMLEIGAGPTNPTSEFLSALGDLTGLDPDPGVKDNRHLRTADVFVGDRYPYTDGAFDVCVSNFVMEHVPDADAHLAEVARVLRPGGKYVFRTPNRFHYVALVSSMTPHWFHDLVANRLRNLPPSMHDPYPTVYALNSRRALRRHAERAGLRVESLTTVEKEPSYGMASRLLFLAFTGYERAVNATEWAADLRSAIFGVLLKPAT